MKSLDLDVSKPEETSRVLRAAADRYRESATDLAAAWQDNGAGRVWAEYARILERAADSCERAHARLFGTITRAAREV